MKKRIKVIVPIPLDAAGVTLPEDSSFRRVCAGRFQEVHVYMSGANPLA